MSIEQLLLFLREGIRIKLWQYDRYLGTKRQKKKKKKLETQRKKNTLCTSTMTFFKTWISYFFQVRTQHRIIFIIHIKTGLPDRMRTWGQFINIFCQTNKPYSNWEGVGGDFAEYTSLSPPNFLIFWRPWKKKKQEGDIVLIHFTNMETWDKCTALRILERLGIQTSSSFVKIW